MNLNIRCIQSVYGKKIVLIYKFAHNQHSNCIIKFASFADYTYADCVPTRLSQPPTANITDYKTQVHFKLKMCFSANVGA